jgi:hypothetical protein
MTLAGDILKWLQAMTDALTGNQPGQNPQNRVQGGQNPAAVQPRQPRARRPVNQRRRQPRAPQNANPQEPPMFEDLINRYAQASEQDFRLGILNALLRTPHRQVEPYFALFKYVHERDPLFFGHLAAWYYENGSVRDLKQVFTAFMATSRFSDEFRSAGLGMLQKLPPYEVERVLGIIKGHSQKGKHVEGIAPSVPRSVKSTIEQYLRERESNHEAFDNVVLHARKSLKTLYASLRIKPGEYAQTVLFDNEPPEGSRLHVLKLLANATEPGEQARLIAEHKIP